MKYNYKYNKKRTFTGKTFNRKYKLEPIIKPKNKNIYDSYKYKNEMFPIINGKKCTKNGTQINFNNRNNYNHFYSPFWENIKLFNKKDYYTSKVLNKNKQNYYNKNQKKDFVSINSDKPNHNNIYYNNFMDKKGNKKIKENQNNKKDLIKRDYLINNNNLNVNNINNIIGNNNNNEIQNKENDKYKEDKNNNEDNENNDNFNEEKEKLFYTNQKNFFKVRKDIIEEPEYLEEDNDNDDLIVGDGGKNV